MMIINILALFFLTSTASSSQGFQDGKTYIIKSIIRDWTVQLYDGSPQQYIPVTLGDLNGDESARWTARAVNISYSHPVFRLENAKQELEAQRVLDYNTCKNYLWNHDIVEKAAYQHWYVEPSCVEDSYLLHTTFDGGKECLYYIPIPKTLTLGKCDRENVNFHWKLIPA